MRKEYDFSKGKRGAVIASPGKTRITIMLDDDLIEHFRALAEAQGAGYQTLINAALRDATGAGKRAKRAADRPLTESVLRKVLREELQAG
jgi:BrnA antitoxin of type II toxin-antitoxin system